MIQRRGKISNNFLKSFFYNFPKVKIFKNFALMNAKTIVVWLKRWIADQTLQKVFDNKEYINEILNKTRSPVAAIGVLKKICNHPKLLQSGISNFDELKEHCLQLKHKSSLSKEEQQMEELHQSNKLKFADFLTISPKKDTRSAFSVSSNVGHGSSNFGMKKTGMVKNRW